MAFHTDRLSRVIELLAFIARVFPVPQSLYAPHGQSPPPEPPLAYLMQQQTNNMNSLMAAIANGQLNAGGASMGQSLGQPRAYWRGLERLEDVLG